jgi:ketosteroid isomerase-like protein
VAENTEIVRAIYAAWAKGDFSDTSWADPGIEFVVGDGPSRGAWHGLESMGKAWADIMLSFEDLRAKAEAFVELDRDRVLVLTRNTGRGKISGAELGDVNTSGANLFYVRDGKVVKLAVYWDRLNLISTLEQP